MQKKNSVIKNYIWSPDIYYLSGEFSAQSRKIVQREFSIYFDKNFRYCYVTKNDNVL